MEFSKVYIMFRGDSSVGIPFEQYEMNLPSYNYDKEEFEELVTTIKSLYEPYCETSMYLSFQNESTGECWSQDGCSIKNYAEY